ncbi:MAG: FAD-dependent thymidylate synthase [Candidatus Methanoperedens sp.]|nr:FAD-dependent thymidylate synthase [Candidatus Methanoperedens sp.]
MIKAEIVCDSSYAGSRLTTFILTYPRFIHAEFMTHRMISRNASSSRAIPVKKQIQEVIDNPAIPLKFLKNQKGMQGGEALENQDEAVQTWLAAGKEAVKFAQKLADLEVHKQYANRILEPWAHITVIATATDWDNFFALRIHPAAQPEICELATQMWNLYKDHKPKEEVRTGYWHLPLVTEDEIKECCALFGVNCLKESEEALKIAIKRSVAKCARVSYKNHDGTTNTLTQDIELYNRLLGSSPIHASPAEHQARADGIYKYSGNFRGWVQYRKMLSNECVKKFDEAAAFPGSSQADQQKV